MNTSQARGRYTRYTDADKAVALEAIRKHGQLRAAADAIGIPWTTLREWSRQDKNTASCFRAVAVDSAATKLRKAIQEGSSYSEKQFRLALVEQWDTVSESLCLPVAATIRSEFSLPNRSRLDLLIENRDGSYTIGEVKTMSGNRDAGWRSYDVIGQLVYYVEVLHEFYSVPKKDIHPCILTDFEPDRFFHKALQNIAL
ncbi:MAG: hypothetical protein V4671_15860, partial [Armatimonadota bacterium]